MKTNPIPNSTDSVKLPTFATASPVFRICLLAAALALPSQAAVLASWDAFADTSVSYDADNTPVSGFTATIGSGDSGRMNAGFGSNDGTFGGTLSGAATTGGALLVRRGNTSTNVGTGWDTLTVTLTNNTGSAYTIDSFHFDFGVRTTSGDGFDLTHVSGLSPAATLISSQTGFANTGDSGVNNLHDLDFTFGSVLTNTTLVNGATATFTLQVTGYASNSASSVIDNIAFQGNLVPEPSAFALSLIGALGLLHRRRR